MVITSAIISAPRGGSRKLPHALTLRIKLRSSAVYPAANCNLTGNVPTYNDLVTLSNSTGFQLRSMATDDTRATNWMERLRMILTLNDIKRFLFTHYTMCNFMKVHKDDHRDGFLIPLICSRTCMDLKFWTVVTHAVAESFRAAGESTIVKYSFMVSA